MKWIKSRNQYINEAKLRDVILPRQAKEVSNVWGEKYLDYEEVTPTDKIIQGKWSASMGKYKFILSEDKFYFYFIELTSSIFCILD